VKQGHPVEEILLLAHAGDYDLLVMGSHGHGKFVDTIMGSTASRGRA
jgi:nucleotide-binding universal stress UspA family protein